MIQLDPRILFALGKFLVDAVTRQAPPGATDDQLAEASKIAAGEAWAAAEGLAAAGVVPPMEVLVEAAEGSARRIVAQVFRAELN